VWADEVPPASEAPVSSVLGARGLRLPKDPPWTVMWESFLRLDDEMQERAGLMDDMKDAFA
jgi:hypothetical protein